MVQRWRTLIVGLAMVLLIGACGGDDDDATTTTGGDGDAGATTTEAGSTTAADGGTTVAADGDPIRVGAIFDLTGATADVGTPFADGVKAYVDWVNSEGGIEGRPIELLNQDYQYDVAQAEQLYSQFLSEGVVAFSGWGTGDSEALRARVNEDEVPFVSASYAETLANPAETPYNFVVAVTYSQQMRIALRHIADESGGEHVEVAVFHNDSPFGEAPLADGEAYIADNGLDIGYETYAMPAGATDFVGELSQAEGQGAEYIIVQNVSSPAATLARDIQAQGLVATVFCLNWCGDELFVELAGDAAEGALGVLPFAPPSQADGDISAVESYLESAGQSLDDINLHFTQGWYQFSVLAEGIRAVVAAGGEVTGPSVKEALEAAGPIDTPVTEPIDFSAESHAGMQAARVYQVQDGAWASVTDAINP